MFKGKLPSEVVNERQQYVNALKQFIEEQKKNVKEVLEQLDISEEFLAKVEPKQICPYDQNHFIPEKSFKKHVEKCRLLKAGYQKDELPSILANTDFCYEGKSSMKIELDESLINKIIWDDCVQSGEVYTGHRTLPVSHIDENINLTQNDRLAIYRHIVSKSHELGKVIPIDKSDELLTTDWGSLVKKGLLDAQNNEKYSSKLEQLAALRDMKRRRQSYRAKNVHVTKKSYTEIIREVIVNQMEVLVPVNKKEKNKECSTVRHRSRSKDRKRKDSKRDQERDSHHYRKQYKSHGKEGKRRYDFEVDRNEKEGNRSKYSKDSDLESEHSKTIDSESIKLESFKSETVTSVNKGESVQITASPDVERNNTSNIPPMRGKRQRLSSASSSQSSDEYHHHHRHKKSKHKKKSKHSKKHSKKHKR